MISKLYGERPAIGRVINQTPRQTHYMLSRGLIKAARQCGGRWYADKVGLRAQFCAKVSEQTAAP
jgi:hypothetical protein